MQCHIAVPPHAQSGTDDTVAELAAVLQNPDAAGLGSDPATRQIFEELTRSLASMYQGSGGDTGAASPRPANPPPAPPGHPGGASAPPAPTEQSLGAVHSDEGSEGAYYDGEDGEEGEFYSDEEGEGEFYPSVREMMGNRPLPVDLWKAAHETGEMPKQPRKLSQGEWGQLVERLNDSSKAKQAYLLQAQHRQIADELSGLTFTPHITKKSRELAAHNKALPERMTALMRRKVAKLDKVRHERAQAELAEATFKPNTNVGKRRSSRRRVGHLMQYEIERRIRQSQRRQILEEVEDRELTFSPQINPNSMRIVKRLTRERISKADEARQLLAKGDEAGAAEAAAASLGKTTARAIEREQAAVAASALEQVERQVAKGKLKRIPLGPYGLTMLPGHEEERFQPKVNPRSQQVAPKHQGRNVYERLYGHAEEQVRKKRASRGKHSRAFAGSAVDVEGGVEMGVTGEGEDFASTSERKVTADGVPLRNTADHVNVVPYAPKWDFIVRTVVAIADEMGSTMGGSQSLG